MSGWYRFGKPGEDSIAHVHRRGGHAAACVAPRFEHDKPDWGDRCGRMSVALCDGPAGETLGGKPLTCDAPLCELHRTPIGPNRDLCPRCVAKQAHAKPSAT